MACVMNQTLAVQPESRDSDWEPKAIPKFEWKSLIILALPDRLRMKSLQTIMMKYTTLILAFLCIYLSTWEPLSSQYNRMVLE
jgi:hypothetical protein